VGFTACWWWNFRRQLSVWETGKTVILDEVLLSSDRKLLSEGPMWAFVKNDIIKLAFALGISPVTLKKFY
jgi:hypothetical protein